MEYDGFSSHGADYQRVLFNQRLWLTNPGTSSKGTSWICPQLLGEVKVMTLITSLVKLRSRTHGIPWQCCQIMGHATMVKL